MELRRRAAYASGGFLSKQDLETEQKYRVQASRRHHRYAHGWGVVCGLWIAPINKPAAPWAVQVCPGFAIDPCGEQINVPNPVPVSLHDYLWRRHQLERRLMNTAFIAIRYAGNEANPIPLRTSSCGCTATRYEASRIRDSSRVDVLWTPPDKVNGVGFDLCGASSPPCPDPLESLYVYLACVSLPASEGDPITAQHIDNWAWRELF